MHKEWGLSLPFRLLPVLTMLVWAACPAMAATVHPFRYRSAALGMEQTAQVYVPAGQPPADGWSVLYLLHGRNGSPTDFDGLGGLGLTLDRLIAEKRIKPLMVVMPEGKDSWYVDSAAAGGPGDYATAVGQDLEQAVEASFPVGKDRDHRAIGGISMGGYGALRLGLMMPERFGAVAALSPAIWQNIPIGAAEAPGSGRTRVPSYFNKTDADTVTVGVDLPPDGHHFGAVFGTPFDPRRFNEANVFTLLQHAVEAKKPLPPFYVSVGDDDSHLLWRGSIAFFQTMQMDQRFIEFRVTDGDHTWSLWKQTLVDALVFVDATLGKTPVR